MSAIDLLVLTPANLTPPLYGEYGLVTNAAARECTTFTRRALMLNDMTSVDIAMHEPVWVEDTLSPCDLLAA